MDKLKLIQAILEGGCGASGNELPFKVGDKVFIRTVTHYQVGRVEKITGKFITLADAAWVADCGRFMEAMRDGALSEVEPIFAPYTINTDSIVDFVEWKHDLPREQK